MSTIIANFNWVEILNATMVMFAVIDIIGSIPLIIKIKEEVEEIHSMQITLVSLFILIAFLFAGESILGVLGVNVESFAVAGAFILLVLALEMVLGVRLFKEDASTGGKSVGIVPLAFPIIAGAGSITTLVAIRAEYEMINITIAIFINMIFVYIVLRSTRKIEKILGPGGVAIIKKVFGIILLAIAVKLFTSNISQLF